MDGAKRHARKEVASSYVALTTGSARCGAVPGAPKGSELRSFLGLIRLWKTACISPMLDAPLMWGTTLFHPRRMASRNRVGGVRNDRVN
jgi:hypothetical protein